MQRKPGFPLSNCSIKMPDSIPSAAESVALEEVSEQMRQRQQLINFGHSQWGFNNWSWALTKQDLDFVDFSNGKYAAGVAAFVSVTVRTLDIHRENVGYATSVAPMKGSAIYQARKGSVTNALRETLLSFGGNVTTDLLELLESQKPEPNDPVPPQNEQAQENNQNIINKPIIESKNNNKIVRKDDIREVQVQARPHISVQAVKNVAPMPPAVVSAPPPIAKTAPLPVTLPPAANKVPLPANQPRPTTQHPRPPSNSEPKPLENMSEEEMRAERKRRQRQAQEEFRQKQIQKQTTDTCTLPETEKTNQSTTEKQDLHKTGFDTFLMDIPTQDILIEETGASADVEGTIKRKSPEPHSGGSYKKRHGVFRKHDII